MGPIRRVNKAVTVTILLLVFTLSLGGAVASKSNDSAATYENLKLFTEVLDIIQKQLALGQVNQVVVLNAQQVYLTAAVVRVQAQATRLSDNDVRLLDAASDPGVPYPKWMVLQLDTAEDPRSKTLFPERYADGGPWKDLRRTRWSG